MAQNDLIELPSVRYTRADFTALRAHLNRISLERIADLYYTEDDRDRLGIATAADLRRRLDVMRDQLVQRACDSLPHLANAFRDARRSGIFSRSAIDYLVRAADQESATPRPDDSLAMWLRPRVADLLNDQGARTIGELVALINRRGHRWWAPIPRIGEGKATALVNWLKGYRTIADRLNPAALQPASTPRGDIVVLDSFSSVLVPLERIGLPHALNGEFGSNRHTGYAQTSARNDLEAIQFYLVNYAGQAKTLRAYTKELERFLLWCIKKQRKAMSAVNTEDCEAYKAFLASPDSDWIGVKAGRHTPFWRPFAGIPSKASQKYAVTIVKSFFEWLAAVAYLRGNPWLTVKTPKPSKKIVDLDIGRAPPQVLWAKLSDVGGLLDQLCDTPDEHLRARYRLRGWAAHFPISAQYRMARALLLLLGQTGLRREEAATATRAGLQPVTADLWQLEIIGKGDKHRLVFAPSRTIEAVRAHWIDRGLDFEEVWPDRPLIAPIHVPAPRELTNGRRFQADSLGRVVSTTLKRIAHDVELDLTPDDRTRLMAASTHAFRHLFGTLAVAGQVPLDVVRSVMGHESLDTTSKYVQAEKQRAIDEIGNYFGR